ncbi:MAG TPA: O-antigen ligase family protein [Planctomycetaceae bacterium]|nr:O-antigen ligase family protein [Planctomycetaceae bacterium]
MSRGLLGLSRALCGGAILAAPWLLSGRPLPVQVGLTAALGAAWICWLLGRLIGRHNPTAGWSSTTTGLVLVGCGGLVLALAHLMLPLFAGLPPEHAVVRQIATEIDWPQPVPVTGTQVPSLTRFQLARLIWPLVALVLGAELFSEPGFRRGLWLLIGINGAAMSVFGMVQRLTWNEQLYWFIPQPTPGQPFASFWNRNHAAGYLNLCLAAVVGLLVAGLRQSPGEWWPGNDDRRLTARAGLIQLLLIVIPLGVLASVSRGGILAAGAASVALVVLFVATPSAFMIRYFLGSLLVAVVLAGTLGVWQLAQSRFEGMSVQTVLEEGRSRHWRDMLPAWADAWVSGTGLGTYRYANRPYQNHSLSATYWNADNEYLELAIEGGVPALVLMILGAGLLTAFAVRACQSPWLENVDQADLGATALFVVIAQGLQAFTDYGISIPANALTFALMLGALTGGWGRRDLTRFRPRRMTWTWLPAAGVSVVMVTGFLEIYSTANASQFQRSLAELENPQRDDWTPFSTDAAIAQTEHWLQERPDDFLLHRTLAQLHIIRYRHHLFAVMTDPGYLPKPLAPEVAWARTQLTGWDAVVREWTRERNTAALTALREHTAFHHLASAYTEFQLARQYCPFDALTDIQLALLAIPCGRGSAERAEWLSSAVQAAPAEVRLLRQIANLTEPLVQDDLAAFCWRRAISLDPESQDVLFKEAADRLAPAYALEHVVEPDAATLLRFAEVIDDPHTRELTAKRLEKLLGDGTISSSGEIQWQLARLAELRREPDKANEHFSEAVRLEPLRWEWRMRYAEALIAADKPTEARQQLETALRIAPQQSQLKTLYEAVLKDENASRRLPSKE